MFSVALGEIGKVLTKGLDQQFCFFCEENCDEGIRLPADAVRCFVEVSRSGWHAISTGGLEMMRLAFGEKRSHSLYQTLRDWMLYTCSSAPSRSNARWLILGFFANCWIGLLVVSSPRAMSNSSIRKTRLASRG